MSNREEHPLRLTNEFADILGIVGANRDQIAQIVDKFNESTDSMDETGATVASYSALNMMLFGVQLAHSAPGPKQAAALVAAALVSLSEALEGTEHEGHFDSIARTLSNMVMELPEEPYSAKHADTEAVH